MLKLYIVLCCISIIFGLSRWVYISYKENKQKRLNDKLIEQHKDKVAKLLTEYAQKLDKK